MLVVIDAEHRIGGEVDVVCPQREDLAGRLMPMGALLSDLPAVTLKGPATLERLKNGVEMGPGDLVAPWAGAAAAPEGPQDDRPPQNIIVRLLTADGDLAGLAKPAKTAGFLHGWVVLG